MTATATHSNPATLNLTAPTFELDSSAGRVRLEQYRGRNTVVFFMREFNCMMCLGHVRELKRLALANPQTQFLIIGGGALAQARQLAERYQLNFPVLADPERVAYARYDLGKALGMMQRSGTAVIDANGVLRLFLGSFNPLASFLEREVTRVLNTL
jgi:thioredoxin-dependent peroxiredoxin